MKIKVRPEDFIVNEDADLPLQKNGDYKTYLLTKRGWNTVDLLLRLSRKFGIPFTQFSYGGKKDRYALTTQHITIKDKKVFDSVTDDAFSLKYIGDMQRPMGPDLITGNSFRVVVRDLNEEAALKAKDEAVIARRQGFINYFDDQRFGSYDSVQGFIGEKIVKKHYNGALKIYLTGIHPEDKKGEKERKRFFFERWGDWKECLKAAKTPFEKRAFKRLLKRESNPFLRSVLMIPREELSLFLSAFQSYLWNKLAERLINAHCISPLLKYRGAYWDYLFYRSVPTGKLNYLCGLLLPTPSQNAEMPDRVAERLYRDILAEHELKPSSFNLRKIRTAYFKSSPRSFVIIPCIDLADIEDDELYAGKKKLILEFRLPRGSYGTMLIKRLMAVYCVAGD